MKPVVALLSVLVLSCGSDDGASKCKEGLTQEGAKCLTTYAPPLPSCDDVSLDAGTKCEGAVEEDFSQDFSIKGDWFALVQTSLDECAGPPYYADPWNPQWIWMSVFHTEDDGGVLWLGEDGLGGLELDLEVNSLTGEATLLSAPWSNHWRVDLFSEQDSDGFARLSVDSAFGFISPCRRIYIISDSFRSDGLLPEDAEKSVTNRGIVGNTGLLVVY